MSATAKNVSTCEAKNTAVILIKKNMGQTFKGLYITTGNEAVTREVRDIGLEDLASQEVLIKVHFSSLNYKDALSASGNKGVTKKFPHVPGIDAAGIIVKSDDPAFSIGAEVIVTGFDLGMNTWGGFGEYISVPGSWIVPLPEGLSMKEAMAFGTAGLTAGLSIEKILTAGITPADGPVIVSGATGGVGSMACAIMSKLGFEVMAISGKKGDDFLTKVLQVKQIFDRNEFITQYNSKPLSSSDFAAGIDNVGGAILSGMLKAVKQNGMVTCCGNVSSMELNTTIFPFILRGLTLAGIDSAQAPLAIRSKVWNQLANTWKPAFLDQMVKEITLEELSIKLDELLQGQAKGRYVLKHS